MKPTNSKQVRTEDGREWPSFAAAAAELGVTRLTIARRTVDGVLRLPKAFKTPSECVDWTGRRFASFAKMCAFYGIHRDTARLRLKSGMSLRVALCARVVRGGSKKTQPAPRVHPWRAERFVTPKRSKGIQ